MMKRDVADIMRDDGIDALRERLDHDVTTTRNNFDGSGSAPNKTPLPFVDLQAWQGMPVPPQEWLVVRRIPHENVTLLGGDGATGKTTISLQLCVAVAAGEDWLGLTVDRVGRVIFYTAEESEKELHRRLAAIPH
jgi:hypothetical protein